MVIFSVVVKLEQCAEDTEASSDISSIKRTENEASSMKVYDTKPQLSHGNSII